MFIRGNQVSFRGRVNKGEWPYESEAYMKEVTEDEGGGGGVREWDIYCSY